MEVRDAEAWLLVDQRVAEMRALPHAELIRRGGAEPEVEQLDGASGPFRRHTRIVALPNDRIGISVRIDAGGRRPLAERGIVVTPGGDIAPEWSFRGEPPRENPFSFGPRVTFAALALCALLLLALFLLV